MAFGIWFYMVALPPKRKSDRENV